MIIGKSVTVPMHFLLGRAVCVLKREVELSLIQIFNEQKIFLYPSNYCSCYHNEVSDYGCPSKTRIFQFAE